MRQAVFKWKEQKLIIPGFSFSARMPAELIHPLVESNMFSNVRVRRTHRGLQLEIELAPCDGLPAVNLLANLAEYLSRHGYPGVIDPWRRGGPTDIDLAARMIGDVYHHASQHRPHHARR